MSKDRALLGLKRKDKETGLHYNRYRYYEPYSARYVSKDPIGLFGGINDFIYVNNPNAWVDPKGLNGYITTGASAILTGIAADTAIPDPTDIFWPKWVGYGVVGAVAGGALYFSTKTETSTKDKTKKDNNPNKCLPANEPTIRAVLQGDPHLTLQKAVSLPVIQTYVARVESGQRVLPSIKTDENIIVDGNHRYIVGRLCKINVPEVPSIAPTSAPRYPIQDIQLSPIDWGNR